MLYKREVMNAELLNSVETDLRPISQQYWEDMHVWPYENIGRKLKTDHVIDLGAGCGLLGIYLVYHNYVKTCELWDARVRQITYAENLVKKLGLEDKIQVHKEYARFDQFKDQTIVSTRFGSLLEFEKFYYRNQLITLRRTNEVDLIFDRPSTLPWKKEIITRKDGFQLELLEFDYHEIEKLIIGERWMEQPREEFNRIIKDLDLKYVEGIGGDYHD